MIVISPKPKEDGEIIENDDLYDAMVKYGR